MLIVPCANLTRISLNNTHKGGLNYIISFVQNDKILASLIQVQYAQN